MALILGTRKPQQNDSRLPPNTGNWLLPVHCGAKWLGPYTNLTVLIKRRGAMAASAKMSLRCDAVWCEKGADVSYCIFKV